MVRWLDFKLTKRCNSRCSYCEFPKDPPSAADELDTAQVTRALDGAVAAGVQVLLLMGGEPTLRADLPDLLRHLERHSGLHVILFSNLRHYPEEALEALLGGELSAARFIVSLDTLRSPNLRGIDPEEVLRNARRAAAAVARHDRPGRVRRMNVHTVISRENLDEVETFARTLAEHGLEQTLGLVCPTVVRDHPQRLNEYAPAELARVEAQLGRLDAAGALSPPNRVLLAYVRRLLAGEGPAEPGCLAGRGHVMLEQDGELFPCASVCLQEGLRFGNVGHEPFPAVYERMQDFRCPRLDDGLCWDQFRWHRYVTEYEAMFGLGLPE